MHRIIVCEVTQILRFKMCTIPISLNLDAHTPVSSEDIKLNI